MKHVTFKTASRMENTGWPVLLLVLVALFSLGACATPSGRDKAAADPELQSSGAGRSEPAIVRVEPVRPKIALTEELLYRLLEAEFAGQRGHLDVAVESYLELAVATRDPRIVERATRIAVFARDNEAAEKAARLWVELDPRSPDPHQVLAVMALRDGNIDSSLEHLQSILDYTFGELDQKLLMIANLLGREADREMVMSVMETLIQTRQESPELLFAFSRVATIFGRYERALELLEQTLGYEPENDSVALSYIAILQRLGRTEDALHWLESTLMDRGDNDFNLRLTYARLLTDERNYSDALGQFEILADQAPNNVDVLFALGLIYLQSGKIHEAESNFRRLSARGHRNNEVSYYLGRIAEERNDYSQAGVWYQGVQAGPNYFDSQIRLALALARQKRFDDARMHLGAIRTQGERESRIIIQAEAEMLVQMEEYEQAMEIYDLALEDDYDADLLYARAMLAEKMDRLDLLERDLRTIIDREPDHAQALNALGYTLADRTERYEEAHELINRALDLRPNDYHILDSKGWVLYRLGRLDEALVYLRRALEIMHDGEIAAHLGEVLWVMGDRKEAKKVWESALKISPDNAHLQDVIQRFNP